MATNPFFSDASNQASMDARTARVNGGFLQLYSGSQPGDANQAVTGTLLAKLPLSATAFAPSTSAGATGSRVTTATANAITSAAGLATATAGYFAVMKSDGVTVEWMGSVGTSSADLNLSSTSVVTGVNVSVSAFTLTQNE
jgi:hypothetical protein